MKKFGILFLFFSVVFSSLAQHRQYSPDGYPILTLEDCIKMAIACDNDEKDRRLDSISALGLYRDAQSAFLPTLSAGLSQSFDLGRSLDKSGVIVDESAGRSNFSIETSYQLFSGTRRLLELDRSKLMREASVEAIRANENNIAVNVIGMYYQVLMEQDMMRRSEASIEQTKYTLNYTAQMVDAGKWPLSKKLEIESQLADQSLSLIDQQNRLYHTRHNLALNVDYGSADSLYIVHPDLDNLVDHAKASIRPMMDIYCEGLDLRSDIRASKLNIKAAEKALKEAKTGYLPTLNFSAGYTNGYFFPLDEVRKHEVLPFPRQMEHNGRFAFTFSLSIPIFDAFRTHSQVAQAKVRLGSAQVHAIRVRQAWYRTVSTAHANAIFAAKKIDVASAGAETAKATLEMVQASFEAGRATSLEIEQARNRALSAEIQAIQAKYDFVYKVALLEEYIKLSPQPN